MLRAALLIAGLLVAGSVRAAEPPGVANLVRQLEKGTAGDRVIAAEQLGDLGPTAIDAIPALTRAARRGPVVGEEGRANRFLRRAAVDALVGIGPKSAVALAELLPGKKDDECYGLIVRALRSFGPDASAAAPALAKLLADEDQYSRIAVAGILEVIGPGAEPAIPDLVALFLNPKNKNNDIIGCGPGPPLPRVAAVRALVRIGPKAAPAIVGKVFPVLAEELKTGKHAPGGTTEDVLISLGETGAPLVPAVVAVVRKNDDESNRVDVGRALLGLGADGRRAFTGLLADKDIEVRRDMVAALSSYQSYEYFLRFYPLDTPPLDIVPFVPALVAAMKDAEPEHRLTAAQVLGNYGDKVPPGAVGAVIALFSDAGVKKLADEKDGLLWRLPNLRQFGEPGARALVVLLNSDSLGIRKIAVEQLHYLPRRWSVAALPRLRKLADDPNAELAIDAAYTAAYVSLDPKDAAPLTARRFIQSPDSEVRIDAVDHLRWLGPLGASHLDALIPLLDDKDDKVVQAAAGAIRYHAPKDSAAARAMTARKLVSKHGGRFVPAGALDPAPTLTGIPALLDALTEGGDPRRIRAALDLGDAGAKAALPALKALLADPNPDLRFAAGYARARIENDLPALRQLLGHEIERAARGRPATWVAAEAFARLPPDFPELIQHVAKWMELVGENTLMLHGLLNYGPKANEAVPALRRVLRGPERPVHLYMGNGLKPACEALGAIGPNARAALPELRQLLDTHDPELALAARDAIRKITGEK